MDIAWQAELGTPHVRQTESQARPHARPVKVENPSPSPDPSGGGAHRDQVTFSSHEARVDRFVVPVLFSRHAMVEKKIDTMVNDAMSAVLHEPVQLPEGEGVQPRMVWVPS